MTYEFINFKLSVIAYLDLLKTKTRTQNPLCDAQVISRKNLGLPLPPRYGFLQHLQVGM
jgi:hypothetical protein